MGIEHTRSTEASGERISGESVVTETNWTVIDDSAVGVHAARVETRVVALLARASTVQRTVCTDHALGSTVWWTADVRRKTDAHCLIVVHATFAIRTTGCWIARVRYHGVF